MKYFVFLAAALLLASNGFAASEIEGVWLSECHAAGVDGAREERTFKGDRFTEAFVSFTGSDCGKLYRGILYEGKFSISGRSATEPGAMNIDFSYEKEYLALYHPDWVQYYNEEKMCGIDNWAVGVTREITGTDCQKDGGYGSFPKTIYSTFRKLKDRLFMGDLYSDSKYDGSLPSLRPLDFDQNYVLFKKR